MTFIRPHSASSARATRPADPQGRKPVLPPLLTVDEVASILKLSSRQVRRLIKDKALPVLRIGCSIRISPPDLDLWVRGHASA